MKQTTKDNMTVWFCSLTHGLIDLASSLVVYNSAIVHGFPPSKTVTLIIMYDLIAFAFLPIIGFLIDHVQRYHMATLAGIALTLTGVISTHTNAIIAVIVVGLGNGLFHLGAGTQILGRYPRKASAVGIFVGPGAVGLSLGVWFGARGVFPLWFLVIVLIITFTVLTCLPALKRSTVESVNEFYPVRLRLDVVIFLLAAIIVRGFAGRTGFTVIQSGALSAIGLGIAACIGKIVGGVLADRFGFGRTTLTALTFAAIGIMFVHSHIAVAFAAMILFQMTMPITLIATSAAIPRNPAFSFGLTCLALVAGTFPAYFIPGNSIQLPFTLILIVLSGAFIILALYKMGLLGQGIIELKLMSQNSEGKA